MSDQKKDATITSIDARLSPVKGPVIGWIASIAPQDVLYVDYEGNGAGPLPAECAMFLLMPGSFASMAERRQKVLLEFERNDPRRPIIIGFLPSREMEEGAAPELVIEARDGVKVSGGEGLFFVSGTNVTVDSRGVAKKRDPDTELN